MTPSRPTATGLRRDMSGFAVGASGEGEPLLPDVILDYDPHLTLPCACGGVVTADPRSPVAGVRAHVIQARHKAWRAAKTADGTLIEPSQ